MKKLLIICITLAIILSSCTVEKRHYLPGFYTTLNIKNRKHYKDTASYENEKVRSYEIPLVKEEINVSNEEASLNSVINLQDKKKTISLFSKLTECDEVILKDGTIINAKVIEIGITEVKYKKCDNLEGPTIVILKSDVFMIKYANGTTEVFKASVPSKDNNVQKNKNVYVNGEEIVKNQNKVDEFSTVSLFVNLLGFLLGLLVSGIVGIFLCIIGVVFGMISLSRIKKNPELRGKGAAIASLILGFVFIFVFIAIIALVVSLL